MKLKIKIEEEFDIGKIDVLGEVNKILLKAHNNKEKQKADTSSGENRIKIACPYCGDSKRFDSKKRGILYLETQTYKCWNCGVWKPWKFFFEDFGSNVGEYLPEVKIESYLTRTQNVEMSIMDIYDFKDSLLDRNDLMFKMGLVDPIDNHKCWQYLEGRKQNPEDETFAYNPRTKDLIIFNLTPRGKVLGLQIRKHKPEPNRPRFISFPYGDIWSKIMREPLNEEENIKAERIKRISLIHKILKIDITKPIKIFEASICSQHFDNSIACWGTNSMLHLEDGIYFLDGDSSGNKIASEMLLSGKKVFLWKKFRDENPKFRDENKYKDFNDLVAKGGWDTREYEKYIGTSKLDIVWL